MEPCSLDCEYYRYAVSECRRQGKPVDVQLAEEVE